MNLRGSEIHPWLSAARGRALFRGAALASAVALGGMLGGAAASPSAEEPSWERLLYLPGGSANDIAFPSAGDAWAAGNGAILHSPDAGRSWTVAHEGGLTWLATDAAPDGRHGWAAGALGVLASTTDGGRTWTQHDSGQDVNFVDIAAIDHDSAIAVDSGYSFSDTPTFSPHVLVRTDDGGASWQRVTLPDGFLADEVEFADDGAHGWLLAERCTGREPSGGSGLCSGEEQALLGTDDGGRTWSRVSEGLPLSRLRSGGPRVLWAVAPVGRCPEGCFREVLRSNDGGREWTVVRTAGQEGGFFLPLAAIDEDTAVVAHSGCDPGCGAPLLRTEDGGETWTKMGAPSDAPRVIACLDARRCLTLGEHTDDGGVTWRPATLPVFAGSGAFDFIDEQHGWFAASQLLRTTDGGDTWSPVARRRILDVDFVSATDGYAVELDPCDASCDRAGLLRTRDAGMTWERTRDIAGVWDWPAIAFADGTTVYVRYPVEDGVVVTLRSDDRGATWRELPPPPGLVTFVSRSLLWAASETCERTSRTCRIDAHVSTSGGERWSRAGGFQAEEGCGLGIEAIDLRHVWVSYARCRELVRPELYRSADGGRTWERIDLGRVGQDGELHFFDANVGRSFGSICDAPGAPDGGCTNALFRTSDGGRTWSVKRLEPDAINFPRPTLFLGPELLYHANDVGGGVTAVFSQHLYRYRGSAAPVLRPPLVGPDTGNAGLR